MNMDWKDSASESNYRATVFIMKSECLSKSQVGSEEFRQGSSFIYEDNIYIQTELY